MAKLNLDYYSGENFYSDGEVEKEILEIARSQKRLSQIENVKFPVLYHLSAVRENILNWYPFKEGATGLEIGSGCGAITGLLCERLSKVISVELSKRRADINFARHERLENLEIWVGNQNDMVFGESFDYIILNGVFEYAMSFTEGAKPYETFLQNFKRLLKPDGVILIAIENRLGLKYFAGAPEDHTDGYFDGIRGYEGNDSVRTFSRGEWEELMHTCGMNHYRFYYPYPDYKFPKEIFTDESLESQKYGTPSWNFTRYRMALFDETQMAATLRSEGVMGHFANSFLIEMSRQPLPEEKKVLYAKLNTDRDRHFSISTVIEERDGERVVVKSPMTYEAKRHIKKMQEQMTDHGAWCPLVGKAEGDSIAYPFLKEESLAFWAAQAMKNGEEEKLRGLVRKVADICNGPLTDKKSRRIPAGEMSAREREEFKKVFGSNKIAEDLECIAPANIDLILDNIFEKDGKYYVIDCEWVFDFPVPVSFILWRTVNELYSSYPAFEKTCPKAELLKEYGITAEMSAVFWKWAAYFAEHYVCADQLNHYSVPEIGVSLEEFRRRQREKEYMVSQLFADTGKGFREEEKIVQESELDDGRFSITFDLKEFKNIQALRFDPIEGKPCICRIDAGKTTVKLTAANASGKAEKGDLFLTTDPVYQIKGFKGEETVTISGEIVPLSMEEALERATRLLGGSKLAFWRK